MGQSASASADTKHRKITPQDKATLQLKKSRDNLNRFTTNTYTLIDNENTEIKKLIRSCKESHKPINEHPTIKLLLKRVHYQKILITKAASQLSNLEEMISNIEFKKIEKNFIDGLTNGNEILKKLNKELNIDYVQDVMDNLHDEMAYEREVDQVLNSNMEEITNAATMTFDDALDKELEQMGAEMGIEPVKKAAPVEAQKESHISLPDLPNLENPETAEKPKVQEQESANHEGKILVPS